MRTVSEIIIHCSATPEGKDYTVEQISAWHRQRGFCMVGYHYILYRDGTCHAGRPLDVVGAHCKGHNAHSIGICYIGGVTADGHTPKDTRTAEQRKAMTLLLRMLHTQFPNATLHGHREFANKACPSFDCHEYDYIFNIKSV
ncbi:N-acetylmuramoyl-L-alanine amidase [Xylanibacter caecicola]|uniref:N-acetylmuramoyl-L-alanine amidase n=1 Tax=Xylanibacter caecicola TaxID=2736294 RepID=UPI00258705C7|nr:N-acetylmuramoyl-L-alanine amidase [Xylanibacter caecicola]